MLSKKDLRIIEMVQLVKVFVLKPDGLSSILGFHIVEEKEITLLGCPLTSTHLL